MNHPLTVGSRLTSRCSRTVKTSLLDLPPLFLAPSLAVSRPSQQTSAFHASTARGARKGGHNSNRGVSALRRTGPKKAIFRMSIGKAVLKDGLPKPVEREELPEIEVDKEHGLWEFFNTEKKLLTEPEDEFQFGRAWDKSELRNKSFHELHQLWYLCVKERNRIATEKAELKRLKMQDTLIPAAKKDLALRKTMKAIKWALTERWYAWEDAWSLAQKDPDIDLDGPRDGETPVYLPMREEDYRLA